MTRWDLARARSQQPARKYRPVGPVGDRGKNGVHGVLAGKYEVLQFGELRNVSFVGPEHEWRNVEPEACQRCGYHVCSCAPEYVPHVFRPPPAPPVGINSVTRGESIASRLDTLERFRELGMLDTPGQREAIYRMLLDGDYSGFGVKP